MTLALMSVGILLAFFVSGWGLLLLQRNMRRVSPAHVNSLVHEAHPTPIKPVLMPGRFSAAVQMPEQTLWKEVSGLSKTEAEELMDWLESNGFHINELEKVDSAAFIVRFQ